MTGINMAASIHFLAAIDNGGYFEGDVSKNNLFRDRMVGTPYAVDADGNVAPARAAGHRRRGRRGLPRGASGRSKGPATSDRSDLPHP